MKQTVKRALTLLLSMVMVLSMTTWASAADYEDMPTGWSREAMEAAVENGLLRGDNLGRLNPQGLLTRSQMAAVVTRAFGAEVADDLSAYSDVDSGAWYYEAISRAAHMGIMSGYDGKMSPERNITRQEAFTVLARALKLADGTSGTLWRFSDADQVAGWATGPMAAMVAAGYVNGNGGRLNPTGNITREEFAQVMYNIFGTYLNAPGTYTQVSDHSLMISAPGVTVKGVTVHGDVIIGDGVGEGDVTLDNVNIEGRLVVRGGGVNSIYIINDSTTDHIIVSKVDGHVRVVVDKSSYTGTISISMQGGRDTVIIEGDVKKLVVESDTPVMVKDASIETVEVTAPNAALSLTGNTTVDSIEVSEQAQGVRVDTEATTTIKTIKTDSDVTLTGQGTVQKSEGEGKVTDESGKEVVSTTTPSNTGSGGISGGSGNSGGSGGNGGNSGGGSPSTHTHSWDDGEVTTPASKGGEDTPAAHGVLTKSCTCGQTKDETIHPWVVVDETDPPACSTGAIVDLMCPVEGCGQTTKGQAPHTIVVEEAVIPTCTEAGKTPHAYCSVCETVISEKKERPALGHLGPWETTKLPTATEDGERTRTCTRCGTVETEVIPAALLPTATGYTLAPTEPLGDAIAITPIIENTEGIHNFLFYLSSDGGKTWSLPVLNLDARVAEEKWKGQGVHGMLCPGTYNKLKIVSVGEQKEMAEAVFDCDITFTVETGGNATAVFSELAKDPTFPEIQEEGYPATVSGFHRTPVTFWVYVSKSSNPGALSYYDSNIISGSGTSANSDPYVDLYCYPLHKVDDGDDALSVEYEVFDDAYYAVYELKDMTVSGHTASATYLQGAWAKCFP